MTPPQDLADALQAVRGSVTNGCDGALDVEHGCAMLAVVLGQTEDHSVPPSASPEDAREILGWVRDTLWSLETRWHRRLAVDAAYQLARQGLRIYERSLPMSAADHPPGVGRPGDPGEETP